MPKKTLFLLRHAKAEKDIEVVDWLRPLKKSGKLAATQMGQWLGEQQLRPDLIISSPAKRAISTAKRVSAALDINPELIRQDERLYNATLPLMQAVLHECSEDLHRIMLVGHNPALEEFLRDIVDQPIEENLDGKLLPKTALAKLELNIPWAQVGSASARLIAITRVKSLAVER